MIQTEVALFCRNEAEGLALCVNHVCAHLESLSEEFLPLKIHLLENGSSDNTAEIATRLANESLSSLPIEAHVGLPAGKSKTWNYFLSISQAPYLVFLDADIRLSPGSLNSLLTQMTQSPNLDIVGAAPALAPDFKAETFWHSVFALPYNAIAPAASIAGGTYVAKKEALQSMPEEVINEDLYLSLKHEGRFTIHEQAPFYVSPPKDLKSFIAQRTRILQADQKEQARYAHKNVKAHRRTGLSLIKQFYHEGGSLRTTAFLMARTAATLKARLTTAAPTPEGWVPASRDH